jgi:hypothetical protein
MLIDRLSNLAARTAGAPVPQQDVLPEKYLTEVLDAADRVPEKTRAALPGYTHVSSLLGLCPRQLVLMRREDRPLFNSVTGGHRVMWRIGRAVETHIRDQFVTARRRRGIIGQWKCRCEETVRVGFHQSVVCPKCNGSTDNYHELPLFNHAAKVVGNPDLLIENNGAVVVVEIKSMNADQFGEITSPIGNHVFQAGMYHDLLPGMGYRPHKQVVIIYCTKQFKYGSPYKEYHVDVTTPALRADRESAVEGAAEVAQAMDADTLPPRTLCSGPTSSMARTCPVVTTCMNLRS